MTAEPILVEESLRAEISASPAHGTISYLTPANYLPNVEHSRDRTPSALASDVLGPVAISSRGGDHQYA